MVPVRPTLSKSEFELLRVHIRQLCGIVLDDSKVALVENRLGPLLTKFGCRTYTDLYVRSQDMDEINVEICCAISTNETSFFRDPQVFSMLGEKLVPDVLNKSTSLHVWSAAASTGQEAYSVMMVLKEVIPNLHKYDIRIEGTDISRDAIAYASYGAYTGFEVNRGVSESRLSAHFAPYNRGFRINDDLRYLAHFRQLNLLANLPFKAEFDLILCRNVAIYFDREQKQRLFDKLAGCLKPGGKLVVGSTETLWQVSDTWRRQSWRDMVYYTLDPED